MFHLIITLDYEIPGDGRGNPMRHMIQPTSRLMDACDRHGAKLTIMAEMGEIWAFEDMGFKDAMGFDASMEIRRQLVEAVNRGHDVQIHLHPQWLKANWDGAAWSLDYPHYRLTDFAPEEAASAPRRGKNDLEALLRPHDPTYECIGFRAGHWNAQPSAPYIAALEAAGLRSDTSVFKWGHATGRTACFDYRSAHSNIEAWHVDDNDINAASPSGKILEVPIAAELVPLWQMVSIHRLRLAAKYWTENRRISMAAAQAGRLGGAKKSFAQRLAKTLKLHPMKLDFCKMTSREMLGMVDRLTANQHIRTSNLPIPLVMIGHSKQVGADKALNNFLGKLANPFGDSIQFSTYRGFINDYCRLTRSGNSEEATA